MRVPAVLGVLAALILVTAAPAPSVSSTFTHLNPGGPVSLSEVVPVQFVFVGFGNEVNVPQFLGELPDRYKPVVRSRLWYGGYEEIGITYTFDYTVIVTDKGWENRFFGALKGLATQAELTLFQQLYNAQRRNAQVVTTNNFIDAPAVEKWLVDHAPRGVDARRNTVFFINWWSRPDFMFHVYTKFGEPDPDTGYDFGQNRHSRKIVAWGGTTPDDEETGFGGRDVRRIWFYDLSAGPEAWGGSYNVDDHDIDGDGFTDYRIPVIWEYGSYRPLSALSSDLGKVARYGAINLLFTPSPLYPPYITPDRQPGSINLDLNTYEGWSGVNASDQYQTQSLLVAEVVEVHRVPYTADDQDFALSGFARECFVKWINGAKCDETRPQYHAFANLFVYNALPENLGVSWDGGAEYEGMFFNYATNQYDPGFLGFADDNWVDGTQSFTFNFIYPRAVQNGYGLTTTQIHEYGHHFGMSHPHDGYDWEQKVDYGPSGSYYFAWLTDEVNSMMSYIDLNWDYSQFDRDNANRYQATAYIRGANRIAAQVLASPNASRGMTGLHRADDQIGAAKAALAGHDYVGTFNHAKLAYEYVRAAAAKAGVAVEASEAGWSLLPPRREIQGPLKRDYSYQDRYLPTSKRAQP